MENETEKKKIIDGLKALFEKARREKLLFRSHYQHVLFTPDELEETQAKGSFIWGAVNWELVSAKDVLFEKMQEVQRAQRAVDEFRTKCFEYL